MANHLRIRDALGRGCLNLEAAQILGRQEALRDDHEEIHRRGEQYHRHGHRHGAEPERAAQRVVVEAKPGVETALGRLVESPVMSAHAAAFRKRLQSIGVRLIDTKPDTRIATPIVTANSCSSRPTTPPMNSTGMKTATSDKVIETIVKATSARSVERRLHRRLAHLHVAHDVLEHHDRVVHDEPDRQGERHQRQVVEAVAELVHHRKRRHDRGRQRQAGDDRRRHVAQEDEDHQDHQEHRDQQRGLDVMDGIADRLRAVGP